MMNSFGTSLRMDLHGNQNRIFQFSGGKVANRSYGKVDDFQLGNAR